MLLRTGGITCDTLFAASLLMSELQTLSAVLAASQATAGSLPTAMETKITSAQRVRRPLVLRVALPFANVLPAVGSRCLGPDPAADTEGWQ